MTEKEWIERCAARYLKCGIEKKQSLEMARASFIEYGKDYENNPEECANEDISNWSDGVDYDLLNLT